MFAGNKQQRFTWFGFQFVRAVRRGRLLGILPLYAEILGLAPVTGPIAFPWIPGRADTVPPNPRKRDADGSGCCHQADVAPTRTTALSLVTFKPYGQTRQQVI